MSCFRPQHVVGGSTDATAAELNWLLAGVTACVLPELRVAGAKWGGLQHCWQPISLLSQHSERAGAVQADSEADEEHAAESDGAVPEASSSGPDDSDGAGEGSGAAESEQVS